LDVVLQIGQIKNKKLFLIPIVLQINVNRSIHVILILFFRDGHDSTFCRLYKFEWEYFSLS